MEEEDEEAGPERQQVGRRGRGWAGETAATGGRVEGRAREAAAGLEGQRLGQGAVGGLERQRPLLEGLEVGAGEAAGGPGSSGWAGEAAASGGRGGGRAGEAANGPERQQMG